MVAVVPVALRPPPKIIFLSIHSSGNTMTAIPASNKNSTTGSALKRDEGTVVMVFQLISMQLVHEAVMSLNEVLSTFTYRGDSQKVDDFKTRK